VLLSLTEERLLELELLELDISQSSTAKDGYITGVPLQKTLPVMPLSFLSSKVIVPETA